MKLNPIAFDMIQAGTQTFETRVYDAKRQLVNLNDQIEFSKLPDLTEKLTVKVVGLSRANTFTELFKFLNPVLGGWQETDGVDKVLQNLRRFYTEEEEKRYGVLAIHLMK